MPLILIPYEYRLGLTRDCCPTCGAPKPAQVVVNGATVVDVVDVSIQDKARGFVLEEFRIVYVQEKERNDVHRNALVR
jgi:hypothetical protein